MVYIYNVGLGHIQDIENVRSSTSVCDAGSLCQVDIGCTVPS